MKLLSTSSFYLLLIVSALVACNKSADVAATSNNNNDTTGTTKVPVVGGVTTGYKDTVTYTVGAVTIKYSRTSQCYPSNEIFAFTASARDVPANAIYNWSFGDGHTASGGKTVGNIYQDAGYYTVTLNITDTAKKSLSITTLNVHAYGQQVTPHASFYAQIFDINYPNNYNFNANGSNVPRGKITNYAWNWGDSTYTSAATPDNTPHNFPQVPADKTYPVQLIVTASSGCKDTAVVPVSIEGVYNISGSFDIESKDICTSEYLLFTSNAVGVPQGAVYSWDFSDDSGPATGNPIKHSFTYQNTYQVKMTISLNGKIIYKTAKTAKAYGQNIRPKALFLKNISYENASSVKWAFYSQANIAHGYYTGYTWDLDNGTIDDNFNTYIDYTYQKGTVPVTKTIKFIVTGNSGCKDTAISYITIPAK